jgi:hypothetical protein
MMESRDIRIRFNLYQTLGPRFNGRAWNRSKEECVTSYNTWDNSMNWKRYEAAFTGRYYCGVEELFGSELEYPVFWYYAHRFNA